MTRLELATPSVTGWCSNQLSYTPTRVRPFRSTEWIEREKENSRPGLFFKRKKSELHPASFRRRPKKAHTEYILFYRQKSKKPDIFRVYKVMRFLTA